MRIWIVNQNAYTPKESAGTRHFELSRRLNERGHEVVVIATSFYHKSRRETRLDPGELFKRENVSGSIFHWIKTPTYSGNTLRRVINMATFAWRVRSGLGLGDLHAPDVIVGSSPPLSGAFGALLLARRMRVPFILEMRDVWPEGPMHLGSYPKWHPYIVLLRLMADFLYSSSQSVISLLSNLEPYLNLKGISPDRVNWIPNGASLRDLPMYEGVSPQQGPFRIMYAGAHGISNAVDCILEAALILKRSGFEDKIIIHLVGDGTHKRQLKEWAARNTLKNVVFHDPVPKESIHSTLSSADAFILIQTDAPMLRWGISPNKLFDYMAVGRPILFAVDTPYNPVEEASCGLTVSQRPKDLANGMRRMAETTHADRVDMGRRARAYVEQRHDYDILANQFEAVVERTVSRIPEVRTHLVK